MTLRLHSGLLALCGVLPIRVASLLLETRFTVLDGLTTEVVLRLLWFVDTVVQVSFVSQHRQEVDIRRHVSSS
jgi:hypothetical protein